MTRKRTEPTSMFDRTVSFKGFSPGEQVFKLPCEWELTGGSEAIAPAYDLFVGKRLNVKLKRILSGDDPAQTTFVEDGEVVEEVADCEGLKVNATKIVISLRFKASDDLLPLLYHMQNSNGQLVVLSSDEIEEEGKDDGEDHTED